MFNVSSTFAFLWSTVQGFLESHTKKKIFITKHNYCEDIFEVIAPNQLQQKFGGNAPNFEGPVMWPPQMPSTDVGVDETKIIPLD